MNDRSVTENISDTFRNAWNSFLRFLDRYDAASWPAFLMFFSVITLGMILGYYAFAPVVGNGPAALIQTMFEGSILSWKLTSNRIKNDKKQNQIANWAIWITVIMAVAMLVVNLYRVGGEGSFQNIAFVIVGVTALFQVVFYLWFDQSNPDKAIEREHKQASRSIDRKRTYAENVVADAEADMLIIRFIATELQRLQNEYQDLPHAQLEYLLEATRNKLLSQYAKGKQNVADATKGLSDVNGDGVIGHGPATPRLPVEHESFETFEDFEPPTEKPPF